MNVRTDMVTVFVVRRSESGSSHEFLQLRRAASDYMGGTWQIIRGGVNAGESYVDAALRELREEAGIEPVEFYRLGELESFFIDHDDTMWHSAPFCALVSRDVIIRLNEEHDAFRWIAREQIDRETMWASERSLLKSLFCDILDDGSAKPHLRVSKRND